MLIPFGLLEAVGSRGGVSDFLPSFQFIKILREKTSADFLGGISLGHL